MTSESVPPPDVTENADGPTSAEWGRWALYFYAPVAILSVGWILGRGGVELLHARLWGQDPGSEILIGLAVGAGVVGVVWLLEPVFPSLERFRSAFARLLGPLDHRTCFWLAVLSGWVEEVLFRATLQPEIGLVWTSALFAALHFPWERDLALWPVFALAAGLLFGGLYDRSQCALAPIVAHFVINLIHLRRIARFAAATALESSDRTEPTGYTSDDLV